MPLDIAMPSERMVRVATHASEERDGPGRCEHIMRRGQADAPMPTTEDMAWCLTTHVLTHRLSAFAAKKFNHVTSYACPK